jgi:hypothetical protein
LCSSGTFSPKYRICPFIVREFAFSWYLIISLGFACIPEEIVIFPAPLERIQYPCPGSSSLTSTYPPVKPYKVPGIMRLSGSLIELILVTVEIPEIRFQSLFN